MADQHRETGYYDRPPSKREREKAKAETEINKILDMLDDTPEKGIIEANSSGVKESEDKR